MAGVCAACGTENRDAAKFCRGCGARLGAAGEAGQHPEPWAQTQPAELSDPPEERTVLLSPAAKVRKPAGAARPTSSDLPPPVANSAPATSHARRWLGIVAIVLALAVGALLWVGLGPRDGSAPPPAAPAAVAPAPPVPVPEPVEPSPAPMAPAAPEIDSAQPPPAPEEPAASAPAAVAPAPAAPRPRTRREAAPEPAAPAPAAQVPAPVAPVPAPAPPPEPAPAADPQQACASLGFIARARCLVAECAKPALARHPQCEAVRQQQQLEDRIRNPDGGA